MSPILSRTIDSLSVYIWSFQRTLHERTLQIVLWITKPTIVPLRATLSAIFYRDVKDLKDVSNESLIFLWLRARAFTAGTISHVSHCYAVGESSQSNLVSNLKHFETNNSSHAMMRSRSLVYYGMTWRNTWIGPRFCAVHLVVVIVLIERAVSFEHDL